MINPIGTQLTSLGLDLTSPVERKIEQPDPAQKVTAAEQARFGSTTNDQNNPKSSLAEQPSSLEKALESVNNNLKAWSTGLRFDMDQDAQRLVVSIVDNDSGDVLRQIPSEAVLRVAKMITQLQGSGVDTQA